MTLRRKPRILISRLSHIGDCILTLPLLNALRAHFPQALLAWVVQSPADQLLKNHVALDHLIVLKRGWMKSVSQIRQLRTDLRNLSCDIAIDPQSLTKSAVVAWLSGARRRIGFARGQGRELAPWLNTDLVHPRRPHLVDKSLQLLEVLGIRAPQVEYRIPVDGSACETIRHYLDQSHLGCGYAVLNPGAGWASRRWPIRRFTVVARHLAQRRSLPSVVTWAGDAEAEWAAQIVAGSGGSALMAPRTNLVQLSALLRSARLFVGSDTGPLHLAAAVGTTCIGLYGTTRPGESGAYGRRHVALQVYYQSGSSRQRRRAENDAMQAIEPEMVCDACDRLLLGTAGARQPRAA